MSQGTRHILLHMEADVIENGSGDTRGEVSFTQQGSLLDLAEAWCVVFKEHPDVLDFMDRAVHFYQEMIEGGDDIKTHSKKVIRE